MSAIWDEGDPRWDDDSATVRFGAPRVALPRPPPPRPWWQGTAPRLAVGLLGVALVILAVGRLGSAPDRGSGGCGPSAANRTDPSSPTVQQLTVDIGGCPAGATFDRSTAILEIEGTPGYRIGAPDDWLLVGDWDCDGDATPALYRPATGVVYRFDRWATDDALPSAAPTPSGVTDGIPTVGRVDAVGSTRGCDEVLVAPGRRESPG